MQNPQQLAAIANQTNAQSNALMNQDLSNSSQYQQQYGQDVNASNAASGNVQNQISYMQGAGSGANVYNQQLQSLQQQYDPNLGPQMANANQSLFGLTGALNGANQQFQTPGGVGAYELSAPALAGYENSILSPLQTGVSNANTQVNTLNSQLGTLMGGANQATTAQVNTEQGALQGLQSQYTNALAQQQQAQSQMQYYSTLAQTQQGLTASQAAAYATAQQGFTTASAAAENAAAAMKTATANAALTNQNVTANANYINKYGVTGGVFGQAVQKPPTSNTTTPPKPTTSTPTYSAPNTLGGLFGPTQANLGGLY